MNVLIDIDPATCDQKVVAGGKNYLTWGRFVLVSESLPKQGVTYRCATTKWSPNIHGKYPALPGNKTKNLDCLVVGIELKDEATTTLSRLIQNAPSPTQVATGRGAKAKYKHGKYLTIRLPEELNQKMQDLADQHGLSKNEMIVKSLEKSAI